jgi:DNA-binding HxlR family transcriptional regulator
MANNKTFAELELEHKHMVLKHRAKHILTINHFDYNILKLLALGSRRRCDIDKETTFTNATLNYTTRRLLKLKLITKYRIKHQVVYGITDLGRELFAVINKMYRE